MPRSLPVRFDDGGGGTVSGAIAYPEGFTAGRHTAVILAHGAGNDMTNPLLVAVADGLAQRGYLSARFNFPYKERRGRAPDRPTVLERCYRAVIGQIRDSPERPPRLIIGGKSLGGRMASHVAAQGVPVDGLVFLGYPLHPPRQPDKLRTAHLPAVRAPMLFITGTRDPLCSLHLLRQTLAQLSVPTTLHIIPDGDHSFALPRRTGRTPSDVQIEVVETIDAWVRAQVGDTGSSTAEKIC